MHGGPTAMRLMLYMLRSVSDVEDPAQFAKLELLEYNLKASFHGIYSLTVGTKHGRGHVDGGVHNAEVRHDLKISVNAVRVSINVFRVHFPCADFPFFHVCEQ
jgi:hypothetical protein